MSRFLPAALAAVLAAPALAGPFEGVWDVSPEACRSDFSDGRIEIRGDDLLYYESACTLTSGVAVEGMENAWLFDRICSGEGEVWTSRALVALTREGEALLILAEGYAFESFRCG